MKTKSWILSLSLGLTVLLVGCTLPTEPTPQPPPSNNTFSCIGQNACNTGAQPSPDPGGGAAGGCAIGSVGNSLHGTSATGGEKFANVRVGEQRTFDTTPKQPNGQILGSNCPIAPVSWSNTNPTACRLNSSAVYTPTMTALAAGTCEFRATISGVTATEPIVISVLAAGSFWAPPTLRELGLEG